MPESRGVVHVWQTPDRQLHRVGMSQASARSSTLRVLAVNAAEMPLRAKVTSGPVPAGPGGWWGGFVFDILVVSFEGPVHHLTARDWVDLFCRSGFDNVVQHRRGGPLPFLLTCGQAVKTTRTIPSRRAA